jgi:hypothetical protein
MAYPFAEIVRLSRHGKSGAVRLLIEKTIDLLSQLGRKALICIQGKDPGIFSFAVGKVFLISIIRPFAAAHLICVFLGDLDRIIFGKAVHDDDLGSDPLDAFKGRLEPFFLVESDDDNRDLHQSHNSIIYQEKECDPGKPSRIKATL